MKGIPSVNLRVRTLANLRSIYQYLEGDRVDPSLRFKDALESEMLWLGEREAESWLVYHVRGSSCGADLET